MKRRAMLKWTTPVVVSALLPTHAQASPVIFRTCDGLIARASTRDCSGFTPVDIELFAVDESITINSVSVDVFPKPILRGWTVESQEPTPKVVTTNVGFKLITGGAPENQKTCWPLMTDVPNGSPVELTNLYVIVGGVCSVTGDSFNQTIDVLPLLSAPQEP